MPGVASPGSSPKAQRIPPWFYVDRRLAPNGGWVRLCTADNQDDAEEIAEALRQMQAR